MEKGKVRDTKR